MYMTCKIGPRPGRVGLYLVYANGADQQSGMQLPMPNLFKLKRPVWLKVMLPMIFFLADKVFPEISLLEKIGYC